MQEQHIKDSEWRHRLINEVIADYIFVIDVDSDMNLKLSWASENILKNTGRTFTEALTPDLWMNIVHPEDICLLRDFIRQMLTTTEKGELECRSFHKEGQQRWIRIFARHKKGPDGKVTHLMGAVREISELKRIEKQLLLSEKKYRELHSSMTDAFVSVNMKGEIQECNESYRKLLGYSEEELLKLTYNDLTPEKWHAMEKRLVEQEILPLGSSVVYEKEYKARDGHIIPVEMRTFLIRDDEGNPSAMWAIARDISERKRNEEMLRAALKEKEILLREVHHRVKNNLQTILALIDLRSSEIRDENSLQIIKEIKEQIRTISVIYQELFQSEKLSRVSMQHYLSILVSNLFTIFSNSHQIKADVDCSDIILDAERAMPCGLIVNELVTNSLKYAFPEGFRERALVSVKLSTEGASYILRVSDNGIGFTPSMDEKQTSSMGLQLVSLWAESQMNGTLDITNHKGSCFTVRFSK
ncbi:MAG: PAS domain S-box protein [Bacteroidetes bacterium]|nr:PAS domain S-box protein [Bacteroidota bacterium]